MATEDPQVAAATGGDEDDETTPGYKPPAQKSLQEITELDQDDESLVKYKQALLADATAVPDEGGSNVLVKSISLVVPGRDDVTLDLSGDIADLKNHPVTLKEGTAYRLKIAFRVQREIVTGLRFLNASYRKGIKVDKENYMLGSYGPQADPHSFTTPQEDAPSGLMARGTYKVKSKFLDDDKHVYLAWEWGLKIEKDW